jgi:uncharacterized damage-inducible protein DinB
MPERFENRDMRGTVFENCDLSGAVFKECLLFGSKITGPYGGITINGINVGRLIWEELLRRYPDRKRLFARDAAGVRDALAYIDELRVRTLERCNAVSEEQLQAPAPDGEWSIADNMRHMIHAEDLWARERALGEPSESPLGRTPSFVPDDYARAHGLRIDEKIPFAEIAREWQARHTFVQERIAALTDDDLQQRRRADDWEDTVLRALIQYLTHEWDHHWIIEQLLDAAAAGRGADA